MITIAPLPRANVAEVAHLQLPPAQRGFVGPIEEMTADPDPLQDFYVIRHDDVAVGFFKIDRDFSRIDARLPSGTHGLRGLLIGGQYQRHGYGAAALSALPAAVERAYPGLDQVVLRVDANNAAAIRAYLAYGWQKSDLPPSEGRSGPELSMTLQLGGADA